MINDYTNITQYYDLWVTAGYYDFNKLAKDAYTTIGTGREVLELGVGTGLLAEQYLKLDSSCQFTGVDFTPSMLEIAKKRLDNKAKLIEADVVTMTLNTTFDAAISNGGVWGILDLDGVWEFGGHVPHIELNRQGLINVAHHLREGGLLLLHLQKPHVAFEQTLPGGIVYSQYVEEIEENNECHIFNKYYFFKREGEIVAQQKLLITCFKSEMYHKMFNEAGFDFHKISDDACFVVYRKRS